MDVSVAFKTGTVCLESLLLCASNTFNQIILEHDYLLIPTGHNEYDLFGKEAGISCMAYSSR